ncbi:tight junction-associated protein 1 isoform X1 [Dermochelys coriacea]|uniref:tight junction-associated protein 1 isoform X1 n=1 Tax=Dermochelys coriacea TaxID=27794 RepID=UPI001CA9FE13|nr:tight junction-associated protein 1 isoform X1 [Dermochelys coriacea]
MTSTAPSKKPYRKAPPQHREIRHDLPILRDDQDGVILAEQSQVTDNRAAKGLAPLRQQAGFSYAEAGQLKQVDGFEVRNLNFSSSWSLESSSDKEVAGCRAELNLKSRTLSPVLPHSGKAGRQSGKHCRGCLGKFMSRSVETVVVSGDEGRRPTCSFKSRSLERSLMFKEPAEVLAPRKFQVSATHLPLKGILKQTGMLEVRPESLRKSRSVETLADGRSSHKYSDPQLCLSPRERRSLERSSSTADAIKRQEKVTEEKLQFSKFLDEITHRVLSPVHLQSLGEGRAGVGGQDSPSSPRGSTPEDQKESQPEGTKRAAEKSHRPSRRKADKKRGGLEMASCRRKPPEEAERAPRLRRKPIVVRKDSKEKFLSLERRVVDLCQYELQQLAELGLAGVSSEQQQQLLPSWKTSQKGGRDRERDRSKHQLRPQHLGTKLGQKPMTEPGYLESASFSPLTHRSQEEGTASPRTSPSFSLALNKEPLTDAERMKLLQHENEELRRRLAYVTNKMEAMERELESGQDYLELELGQNREELEKFKDKFRRLQNSYTASQRTNQDLEEKLHTLIKKAEMDRKTLDWEIVELTNKLLDAKTTINKLEELNERYRQDCNLAVQLLKCNKSHFRNHKFADLPYELQDMVNKHLRSTQESPGPGQEAAHTLAPSDVVPTSVIARVLEKPESLVLNSAKSSSGSCPMAEDVFVHVDMSGALLDACPSPGLPGKERGEGGKQQNGGCKPQSSVESLAEEVPAFEKLSPYPTPSPPHPMFPGRKVIEFSEDKVRIPKNSPLPNCTYATRQAISLSLVQGEDESNDRHRTLPNSPVSEGHHSASSCSYQPSPKAARAHGSSQSSPFSSPPQIPSAFASSASSEEDLLANWQRMFVDKAPPTSEQVLVSRTSFSCDMAPELQKRFSRSMQELGRAASAYSDGEESAQSCSWTVSRDSSVDTDSTESRARRSHFSSDYGMDFSQDEARKLLQGSGGGTTEPSSPSPEKHKDYVDLGSPGSPAEEREMLLQASKESSPGGAPEESGECRSKPPSGRPHRSPKRMGVHHLHRKDSLTQAQEQGNLLN